MTPDTNIPGLMTPAPAGAPAQPVLTLSTGSASPAAPAGPAAASPILVPAHTQSQTLHIVEYYHDHEPREHDAHYHIFNQARARLKRLGLLQCWIGNHHCAGGIELHHNIVEYSEQLGIDLNLFEQHFPEFNIHSDEDFAAWIESEGNLLPLCVAHHRGIYGIHCIPYPLWRVMREWRSDLPAPAQLVTGKGGPV